MNMHLVAMQFAAGRTFFVGMVLVVAACALRYKVGRRGLGSTLTVAAVAGGLLVLLSGTPLPLSAYGLWLLALGSCITASEIPQAHRGKLHTLALAAVVIASAGMVAAEFPYHLTRPIVFPRDRPVFVIGDSLALALETGVEPWPNRFAAQSGLQVTNVMLIPKGCMASILADPSATVDGLHLSGVGHARLAALVTHLVQSGSTVTRPTR